MKPFLVYKLGPKELPPCVVIYLVYAESAAMAANQVSGAVKVQEFTEGMEPIFVDIKLL